MPAVSKFLSFRLRDCLPTACALPLKSDSARPAGWQLSNHPTPLVVTNPCQFVAITTNFTLGPDVSFWGKSGSAVLGSGRSFVGAVMMRRGRPNNEREGQTVSPFLLAGSARLETISDLERR